MSDRTRLDSISPDDNDWPGRGTILNYVSWRLRITTSPISSEIVDQMVNHPPKWLIVEDGD